MNHDKKDRAREPVNKPALPPRIEYLKVQNFRVLREVKFDDLSPLTVLLGPNGSGKSTVFDVFAFLAECFEMGLRRAWDKRGRAKELRSRDAEGPITIEIKYQEPQYPMITSCFCTIPCRHHLLVLRSQKISCTQGILQERRGLSPRGKPVPLWYQPQKVTSILEIQHRLLHYRQSLAAACQKARYAPAFTIIITRYR